MTMLFRAVAIAALVASLSWVERAQADWINLTGAETAPNIAEIYVLDDHVKLVLEIYVDDLMRFEPLIPDDWLTPEIIAKRPPPKARLREFARQYFQFVTDRGQKLAAELVLVEPRMRVDRKSPFAGMINPITRTRMPEPPADKRVLYAELVYPFKHKPKTLTMIPPLDDEGRAKVSIGFITYHKAVPVIDFRYLGAAAKLHLDWEDPWYSKFDNPNLKRHHKSALMSFLYVEPYEVRHEVLTRVRDLGQWMDLGLRGNEYIELDELEPLKRRIGEFMLAKNTVRVDGEALKPILDRMNYVKVSLTGIQLLEQPERLELSTAIVGVILAYLTDGLPQKVTVDWELFTDQVQQVPFSAIDPAGPLPSFITPDDRIITWTNFLKNYQAPQVVGVMVDESMTTFGIPVISIFCLFALAPIVWQIQRRQARQQSIKAFATFGVIALLSAWLAFPYMRVSVTKPTAITPTLPDAEAVAVLESLLKNVYRAFDFRAEEDIYDKLAISVAGDMLADVYLQNRKSFAVKKAGGAQAKVKEVAIQNVSVNRLDDRPIGYAFNAAWTAMGTVGHWGHVHTRMNQYNAVLTVEPVEGIWKITGLELLEEKRIDPYAQTVVAAETDGQSTAPSP